MKLLDTLFTYGNLERTYYVIGFSGIINILLLGVNCTMLVWLIFSYFKFRSLDKEHDKNMIGLRSDHKSALNDLKSVAEKSKIYAASHGKVCIFCLDMFVEVHDHPVVCNDCYDIIPEEQQDTPEEPAYPLCRRR